MNMRIIATAIVIALFSGSAVESKPTKVVLLPVEVGMPKPQYPRELIVAGVTGVVAVSFVVTPEGSTQEATVVDRAVSTAPVNVFDEVALAAVQASTWKPATENGKPIPFRLTQVFEFVGNVAEAKSAVVSEITAACRKELSCNAATKGCVNLTVPDDAACPLGCAIDTRSQLRLAGVSTNGPHYSGLNSPVSGRGCIGVRKDLGGTDAGAMCLANLLGPNYETGHCTPGGWPYNVKVY
jgi:TonB family protein